MIFHLGSDSGINKLIVSNLWLLSAKSFFFVGELQILRNMRYALLVWLILGFPLLANSQDWEVGIFAGGANYNGELAPVDPVVLRETHIAIGGFAKYALTDRLKLRGSITYATISGDDANFNKASLRKRRNLDFRSPIFEFGALAEYEFLRFNESFRKPTTAFYGVTGLAIFNFNPEAQFQGKWVELQPLGTEGQGTSAFPDREKYSLTQISIPIGIGVTHSLSRHLNIGAEVAFRKTFTDYLDDVSKTFGTKDALISRHGEIAYRLSNRTWETFDEAEDLGGSKRGNSDTNDWYYFGGVTLSYTFTENKCPGFGH